MNSFAEGIAWLATAGVTGFGLAVTGSPFCLLALFFPAITYSKTSNKDKAKEDKLKND